MFEHEQQTVRSCPNKRATDSAAWLSQLYDVEEYDRAMASESLNVAMWDRMLALAKECVESSDTLRILEIGAGSGLFTERLLRRFRHAVYTVVDPDGEAMAYLRRRAEGFVCNLVAHEVDILTFRPATRFALVVSSLADHHIRYEDKEAYFRHVASLLAEGGVFISGDEFIPPYKNQAERRRGLIVYHACIIKKALRELNLSEVRVESVALEKGLHCDGEYKTSIDRYLAHAKRAGLQLQDQHRVGPTDTRLVRKHSGAYVHVFRQALPDRG